MEANEVEKENWTKLQHTQQHSSEIRGTHKNGNKSVQATRRQSITFLPYKVLLLCFPPIRYTLPGKTSALCRNKNEKIFLLSRFGMLSPKITMKMNFMRQFQRYFEKSLFNNFSADSILALFTGTFEFTTRYLLISSNTGFLMAANANWIVPIRIEDSDSIVQDYRIDSNRSNQVQWSRIPFLKLVDRLVISVSILRLTIS